MNRGLITSSEARSNMKDVVAMDKEKRNEDNSLSPYMYYPNDDKDEDESAKF